MSDHAFKIGDMVDYRPSVRFAKRHAAPSRLRKECRQRMATSDIALKAQTNLTNGPPMRVN
jgi:hypothetical protein